MAVRGGGGGGRRGQGGRSNQLLDYVNCWDRYCHGVDMSSGTVLWKDRGNVRIIGALDFYPWVPRWPTALRGVLGVGC
ncbi:unnamed protein product [Allacma fusca]|uniref:Uncharacterized protein n=1 Tax=Allacma fusca TaxID=39272 RepID=A0A8J2K5W3_9HEXA|nr:unnamed protein product [Allacma fusca]